MTYMKRPDGKLNLGVNVRIAPLISPGAVTRPRQASLIRRCTPVAQQGFVASMMPDMSLDSLSYARKNSLHRRNISHHAVELLGDTVLKPTTSHRKSIAHEPIDNNIYARKDSCEFRCDAELLMQLQKQFQAPYRRQSTTGRHFRRSSSSL